MKYKLRFDKNMQDLVDFEVIYNNTLLIFQAVTRTVDLDKMEIIQLDPERDLRASPVSDGSRCNSLLLCRFMSWDLLTMVISSESRDEDLPAGEPLVINQFGLNLSSISAEDASAAVLPTQARE
ncbi:hypothetical protein F2Q69_00019985 [Brassica cretica]|uniref:Uncharacterized protein n=1 Tax=Brassica cretica TaxID=69181 RepID=A0A8S9QDM5_BRACR|nr:hypothetical protein F2Q69_00019985 [Brassica cretica]